MRSIAFAVVVLAITTGVASAEKLILFELREEKLSLRDDALDTGTVDPSKPAAKPVTLKVSLVVPIRDPAVKATTPPAEPPPALETIRARVGRSWLGTRALADGTFTAKIVAPTDTVKEGWRLTISCDRSAVERAGPYKLAIDLHVEGSAERLQTLTVVLDRPAPKVRVIPDSILIEIVQDSWFPHDVKAIPDTSIAIVETQGDVPAIVDARDLAIGRNDGHAVSGRLVAPQLEVLPGTEGKLTLSLKDELPPGKTSGKLALQPRDGERIELPYEIRTRLGLRSIILMLVVGWLIGVGMRTTLAWFTKRFRRQQEIIAVEVKASRLADSVKDGSVNFKSVVTACETARHKLRIPEDAAATLQKSLDAKMAELQPRLDAARASTHDLTIAVTPAWKVAPEIQTALLPFRTAIATATRLLADSDATRATAVIAAQFDGPAKLLFSQVEAWRRSMLDAATKLAAVPETDKWPESTRRPAKDAAEAWETKIREVPTQAPTDPSSLQRMLRALHEARVSIEDGAISIATNWKLVADATVTALADLEGPPLSWLVGALPEVGDGESYPARIVGSARDIVPKVTAEILKLIPPDAPFMKSAEDALAAGKWALAAKLAHDNKKPPAAGFTAGHFTDAPEVAMVGAKRLLAIEPAPRHVDIPDLEVEAKRARRWELATVASTSILSGVILLAVTALSIAKSQPATCMDLLGIAAQAFSVDVGVAAVLTALKNVAK